MNLINQICEIKVAKGFKATVSTDGNIIVEKEEKEYILKEGDFFHCSIGNVSVYGIFKDIIGVHIRDYCVLFTNYNSFCKAGILSTVFSCKNMRLLTEEEKEILLTRIKQEGYVWNAESKTLTESNIIGYKLSGYVSKEIADIVMGRSDINMSGGDLYFIKGHIAGYYVERAKDLGILDTWFIPVYEDDSNTD